MTKQDILMIKGVRKVVEKETTYSVYVYLSPWYSWSTKRKGRVMATLTNRLPAALWFEIKTWWW